MTGCIFPRPWMIVPIPKTGNINRKMATTCTISRSWLTGTNSRILKLTYDKKQSTKACWECYPCDLSRIISLEEKENRKRQNNVKRFDILKYDSSYQRDYFSLCFKYMVKRRVRNGEGKDITFSLKHIFWYQTSTVEEHRLSNTVSPTRENSCGQQNYQDCCRQLKQFFFSKTKAIV